MAVVPEDGTIVPGANSFVSVADVAAYASDHNLSFDENADGAAAAVLEAGNYLRNEQRYVYRGQRMSYLQTMPWPRDGASEYRGPALPSNYIPWRVKDAQCMLAIRALAAPGQLQADLAHGGRVKSEKVDVIETTYMDSASPETLYSEVLGVLQPLLIQALIPALPYQAPPADEVAFEANAFSNPPLAGDVQ